MFTFILIAYKYVGFVTISMIIIFVISIIIVIEFITDVMLLYGTAISKGKTPVPVCSPKLSSVGRG